MEYSAGSACHEDRQLCAGGPRFFICDMSLVHIHTGIWHGHGHKWRHGIGNNQK